MLEDDRSGYRVERVQQVADDGRLDGFRHRGEASKIAEQRGDFEPFTSGGGFDAFGVFEELFGDGLGYIAREQVRDPTPRPALDERLYQQHDHERADAREQGEREAHDTPGANAAHRDQHVREADHERQQRREPDRQSLYRESDEHGKA